MAEFPSTSFMDDLEPLPKQKKQPAPLWHATKRPPERTMKNTPPKRLRMTEAQRNTIASILNGPNRALERSGRVALNVGSSAGQFKTENTVAGGEVDRREDVLPELVDTRRHTVEERLNDSSSNFSASSTVISSVIPSTSSSTVSSMVKNVKKEFSDEDTVVRPGVDRGEDVTAMAMSEKGASTILSHLNRRNLDETAELFRCIKNTLLQLAMNAHGHRVVKWFISNGTKEQRLHLFSLCTSNLVTLVQCRGYGRLIAKSIIKNCQDSKKKSELNAEFQRALTSPTVLGDDDSPVERKEEEVKKEVKKEEESDDDVQIEKVVPAPKKLADRPRLVGAPLPNPVDPSDMIDQAKFMRKLNSIISVGCTFNDMRSVFGALKKGQVKDPEEALSVICDSSVSLCTQETDCGLRLILAVVQNWPNCSDEIGYKIVPILGKIIRCEQGQMILRHMLKEKTKMSIANSSFIGNLSSPFFSLLNSKHEEMDLIDEIFLCATRKIKLSFVTENRKEIAETRHGKVFLRSLLESGIIGDSTDEAVEKTQVESQAETTVSLAPPAVLASSPTASVPPAATVSLPYPVPLSSVSTVSPASTVSSSQPIAVLPSSSLSIAADKTEDDQVKSVVNEMVTVTARNIRKEEIESARKRQRSIKQLKQRQRRAEEKRLRNSALENMAMRTDEEGQKNPEVIAIDKDDMNIGVDYTQQLIQMFDQFVQDKNFATYRLEFMPILRKKIVCPDKVFERIAESLEVVLLTEGGTSFIDEIMKLFSITPHVFGIKFMFLLPSIVGSPDEILLQHYFRQPYKSRFVAGIINRGLQSPLLQLLRQHKPWNSARVIVFLNSLFEGEASNPLMLKYFNEHFFAITSCESGVEIMNNFATVLARHFSVYRRFVPNQRQQRQSEAIIRACLIVTNTAFIPTYKDRLIELLQCTDFDKEPILRILGRSFDLLHDSRDGISLIEEITTKIEELRRILSTVPM